MFPLKIREETDTKIELPSEGSDSDVIVITGHKAQVEAAKDKILAIQNELVNNNRCRYVMIIEHVFNLVLD